MKITEDELGRTTARSNSRAAWVVGFVNRRQERNMRGSESVEDKITGILRKAAVRNKIINSVLN